MAQEHPKPWNEWLDAARTQTSILRERLDEWLAAVREEPVLIWQTTGVRYATYGVGGLIVLWMASGVLGILVPPPPENARPAAGTADFHVVCMDPDCGYHHVIHREFGFRKFPVVCPKCEQRTGARARPCNSKACGFRWVAPQEVEGTLRCPRCGRVFE